MDKNEIKARLTLIFRSVFTEDSLEIQDTMTAADVKRWDSLSHINMIYAVEEDFGVKFRIKDTRNMKNVGDLIELIHAKLI